MRRLIACALLPLLAGCSGKQAAVPPANVVVIDYGGGNQPVAQALVRQAPGGAPVVISGNLPRAPAAGVPMAPGVTPGGVRPASSGTAFAVTPQGIAATNAHVVEGCQRVEAEGGRPLRVLATDRQRDLALLETGRAFAQPVRFRADAEVALGEPVLVFGYPYGQALGTGLNVNNGIVTAGRGLGGNDTRFQTNAAIQPGNSGGPVVDGAGLLLGIAVSRLNEMEVYRRTGSLPQGINFAVRAEELVALLRENGLAPARGEAVARGGSRNIAASLAPAVFQVFCRR